MRAWTAFIAAATFLVVGCDATGNRGIGEAGSPDDTVRASGEAARTGAQATMGLLLGDATNPRGAGDVGGTGVATPSALAPVSDVFAGGTHASKPQLAPQQAKGEIGDWQGPEVGPDGQEGWYRRIYTWSQAGTDSTAVEQVSSYWFKTEPAHDFAAHGWDDMAVDTQYYAWTADAGFWTDFMWLSHWTYKHPYRDLDGNTVAGAVEGEWQWSIKGTAEHYAGTHVAGTFRYRFPFQELFYHQSETRTTTLRELGAGKTLKFSAVGEWYSTYEGEYYDDNNELSGSNFGGGAGESAFTAAVTKVVADSYDIFVAASYGGVWYWATGAADASVDYLVEPAYAADTTPPGEVWGELDSGHDNDGSGDDARDGLLAWAAYSTWFRTLFGVVMQPDGSLVDGAASTGSASANYSRTRSLSARGGPPYEYVSCSTPDVAPDCPETPVQ